MPIVVSNEEVNVSPKQKKIVILMKKTLYLDKPEYKAFVEELRNLYAKGLFDDILIIREDEDTLFKLYENEYVVASLKDLEYLKQKVNALAKTMVEQKESTNKFINYLKDELFSIKGKIMYFEDELIKQRDTINELKKVTKTIIDMVRKLFENQKLLSLKAQLKQ
ncbi:NEQ279 [Nanoarchaeum equitans Kin4-M]|uniref:NEQ279 n=1 Tax=Nanoarchaeum equitans (strain Kin4-M) TaxID=228908 RepID=Q74MU0_NANEQ|nr:NEQ279 [Nanoarchaeum equitans Kin4-M]